MRFSWLVALLCLAHTALASPELHVAGTHFVDASGRTVILRGVNVSGNSKVPPFLPFLTPGTSSIDLSQLDPLASWGMNVIRLIFVWEGYEPAPGAYQQDYLDQLTEVVDAAWARGIYTIIDMHQDSFSRYVGTGCGAGFPAWVAGAKADLRVVENCGTLWGAKTAFSHGMHRAFKDFYADKLGGRTSIMEVWRRLARHFRGHPGVIGYDLLNEPWGHEAKEISPYYEDAARAVRSEDPSAILFIEPHIMTVVGFKGKTKLKRPTFSNFVFAPHFYDAYAVVTQHYLMWNPFTKPLFNRLPKQANLWGVPLHIGEFGSYAKTVNVQQYVERQYDLLDSVLASGTQWNYTPEWSNAHKDGWNDEDYSVVNDENTARLNFVIRPYPRKTAGIPLFFRIDHGPRQKPKPDSSTWLSARSLSQVQSVEFSWTHDPRLGATELFYPKSIFFDDEEEPRITTSDPTLTCTWDFTGELLSCVSPLKGFKKIVVTRRHAS